ncbi:MAG: TlpA family protein disulfide reductase, partial [Myxococcaceae bacterium]
ALPFPVLVGSDAMRSGETGFGHIAALPTTFVFDREGKVLLAYQGVASPERLLEVVAKAVLQP